MKAAKIACGLWAFVSILSGQPVVNDGGAVNSASYVRAGSANYGIAQGSVFTVFGKNLGSGPGAVASDFPLRTELAGTSIQLRVEDVSVDALMIYATPTQLGAVLPSPTPIGNGWLKVTYNHQTSAPISVKVVKSNFGVYSLFQNGAGPAIVTDLAYHLIDSTNPSFPDQILTLWGTGLGPVTGDEAAGPLPMDLNADVKVVVGGQQAPLVYKGRSGCCAGLDQISFRVPAGVAGCALPLSLTVEGVAANFTTLAVAQPAKTCSDASPEQAGVVKIGVNSTVRYQTMQGWETTAYAKEDDPAFPLYKDQLFDAAVHDLGLNRVRLEIRAGAENAVDYWSQYHTGEISADAWRCHRYATVNDNDDPFTINWAGFQFSELDSKMESVVLPLKQRLDLAGEKMWVNVEYVAFTNQICDASLQYIHTNPEEYAEFVLAAYLHLRDKYGIIPDSWEIILEPDNTAQWGGAQIGNAIVAAAARLAANGFTPRFIGPSTASMTNAVGFFDQMLTVPGAVQRLWEYSYHRYSGVSDTSLQAIEGRALQYGLSTAMLEHIGSGYRDLHQDLKMGRDSAWQLYALASADPSTKTSYYYVDTADPANPALTIGEDAKFLRQYFKFVRSGAVRIDAAASNPVYDPLAFVNPNGKYVVIVAASAAGYFAVSGLPPGTYGIKYTTLTQYDMDLADVKIGTDQLVDAPIPDAGVITIYGK